MLSSAHQLKGKLLDGGWSVIEKITKDPNSTGGKFSVCYLVESHEGKRAFLKAIDLSGALLMPDPALELKAITEAYIFERDVLNKCRDENLDRIVIAITDGVYKFNNAPDGGVVQYLIFERADGDVRKQADLDNRFNVAWSLRSLHNIATGIQQLHSHGIAHQDLKPSNVLIFKKNTSKIADFGRAAYKGHIPPHENCQIPGDLAYAPPELLYNHLDPDWNFRRFGCDTYLLGSMVVFFFCGVGMTSLLLSKVPEQLSFRQWQGSFYDVLPYLKSAFEINLTEIENSIPDKLKKDLLEIIKQLCEPDPQLRGYPRNRNTASQFEMQRYISWFNLLASQAEYGIYN